MTTGFTNQFFITVRDFLSH